MLDFKRFELLISLNEIVYEDNRRYLGKIISNMKFWKVNRFRCVISFVKLTDFAHI